MKYCVIFFVVASSLLAVSRAAEAEISLLDNSVLRLRANQLTENLSSEVHAAKPSSRFVGTVLDLRFAETTATNAADYLARQKGPVVVLVNSQTRGAAAALAAQLRATAGAILIGSTNSPGAIAPDISVAASLEEEKKFQEDPYLKAATNAGALSATNNLLAFIDHTSEAELVRKRVKDGEEDADAATPRAEPPHPVIRDPALARAVDLLKALAVLHPAHG